MVELGSLRYAATSWIVKTSGLAPLRHSAGPLAGRVRLGGGAFGGAMLSSSEGSLTPTSLTVLAVSA